MSTAVATATQPREQQSDRAQVAFESLYRSSRDDLYAYVAGLLRDRSAAEEVTSHAFERAWRKRRQLKRERGSARAWLFGIARNAALDELRRRARLAEMREEAAEAADSVTSRAPAATDPATTAIDRVVLRQAVAALGGRDRELIALKFFAGLSNAEIGTVIGVSESNAGTRLHRAVEKLRREIDEAD